MGRGSQEQARVWRDVLEFSLPQVLEKEVAHPNGGDKQIRQTIIIDVSERSGDEYFIPQPHSCRCGYVLKFSLAEVAPKFIASDLIHEIQVQLPIAIHIRHRQASPMVV